MGNAVYYTDIYLLLQQLSTQTRDLFCFLTQIHYSSHHLMAESCILDLHRGRLTRSFSAHASEPGFSLR